MKNPITGLLERLVRLAKVLFAVAWAALLIGFPPVWVGLGTFAILDFAGIVWAGRDAEGGSRLRQARRGEHHYEMARAAA